MFYFDGQKWTPFAHKVSYIMTVVEYDNDVSRFPADATIEENKLTEEELERLDVVKHANVSLEELTKYVKTGEAQGQAIEADKADRKRKAFISAIDLDAADDEILEELARPWEPDGYFTMGEPVSHNGARYKVLQSHPAQPDWSPDVAHSLFAPFLTSPTGRLPWIQPDNTNPYMIGDQVTFNGKTYESTIDNNVWSPEAYPQGWREV